MSGFRQLCWLTLLGLSSAFYYDTPEDCAWEPRGDTSVFLTCRLSSINSRLERTNFSVIPSDSTVGLKIVCTEDYVGSLESAGFSSLDQLQELVIENCALQHIAADAFLGLASLRSLSVSSVNQSSLSLSSGALNHLTSLQSLDLSHSGIRSIPRREICKLSKLTHLNLSHNQLGSVADLGGDNDCLPQLQVLDLSHNEVTSLDSLSGFSSLKHLRVNNNFIRFISADVFSNSSIKILDMSNNQINHLPQDLFHHLPLQSLHLANNTLSSLSVSLLKNQKQLETLDLSGNFLTSSSLQSSLTRDMFSLIILDLSNNQIESVSTEFLATFPNLQVLKMKMNKITRIKMSPVLFQLRELNLDNNRLAKLDADHLTGLESLTHLSLANNQIREVQATTFRNTSQLLVLDISNNNLDKIPESLRYLTNLQTLDIGDNMVESISDSPLTGMTGLWRLQLHGNRIRNISQSVFTRLRTLQIVDLSRNEISRLQRGTFDQNQQLRAVRLDGNVLEEIDGVFNNLPQLIWLNVSQNIIKNFDYSLVPRTLHWLDLSHNKITDLGNYFDLSGDLQLTYLNAGFNRLTSLAPVNVPDSVETLLLNDNNIAELMPYTFFKKSKLVKVDLSVNELSSISQTSLRLSSEVSFTPQFLLGGNPIICDCEMQWFKSINDNNNSIQRYPSIADLESIYCKLVYTTQQAFIPLVDARSDQFLCSYSTHCFSLCQCCQFDSCDCEMICPEGCNCFHDNSWSKNIIQCSSNQYTTLPTNMPMDATEIYLDGNNLGQLKSHSLIGRKNLRALYLNNSNIEKIENKTFNGLRSLRALHLENNRMKSLQGFEFTGLTHLRELYLQGNLLTFINNTTFKALKSLEILNLEGNSIIDFPIWQLAINPYLVSIKIANNLWSCDCQFLNQLAGWMKVFRSRVIDSEQISCVSNDLLVQSELLIDYEEKVCEGADLLNPVAKNQIQELNNYLPVMIAATASILVLVIFGLVMFCFRHSLKIWLRSKCEDEPHMFNSRQDSPNPSTISTEVYDEAPELFDTFVSYSPLDSAFVQQILSKELEAAGLHQRVCLQHRDLPAHTQHQTLGKVVQSSRKTIIILSNNFVRTEWSSELYQAALINSVHNKNLVFVLLGSQDQALASPGLCSLLSQSIILQWGEPQFWTKLQCSLPLQHCSSQPRPESHYYSTCRFSTQGFSDKDVISHI